MKRKLTILAQEFKETSTNKANNYGAPEGGVFELSNKHKAVLVLEKGSFSCANCEYVNAETHECNNEHYRKWNAGSKKLPDAELTKICSDWFEPA